MSPAGPLVLVSELWVCGMSHLVQGRAFSASGDLPAAQSTLVRGIELAQRGAGPLDIAWGTLTLAGVLAGLGDELGARAALAQARSTLANCPDPGPILHDLLAATTRRVGTDSPRPTPHGRTGQLNDRECERDVLQLLATPLSQREIADELHLSLNTTTRAQAVTTAHEHNLL